MLATFMFEVVSALYILIRYRQTKTALLIVAILLCLATFQGAEYLLCGGFGMTGGMWSKTAYLAITLLPPLGLHLAHAIAGRRSRVLVPLAYATALGFMTYFALYVDAVSGRTCYANYVVFESPTNLLPPLAYGIYYYGWLIVGIIASLGFVHSNTSKHRRAALVSLAVGYLAFLIPTTTVNIIDPSTIAGIPSIMCGFAVILAAILVAKVAPDSAR